MPRLIISTVIVSAIIQITIADQLPQYEPPATPPPATPPPATPPPRYETAVEYPRIKHLLLTNPDNPTKHIKASKDTTYLPMKRWKKICWGTGTNIRGYAAYKLLGKTHGRTYKQIVNHVHYDHHNLERDMTSKHFTPLDIVKRNAEDRAKEFKKCRIENPGNIELFDALKENCKTLHENVMTYKAYFDDHVPRNSKVTNVHSLSPQSIPTSGYASGETKATQGEIEATQGEIEATPGGIKKPKDDRIVERPSEGVIIRRRENMRVRGGTISIQELSPDHHKETPITTEGTPQLTAPTTTQDASTAGTPNADTPAAPIIGNKNIGIPMTTPPGKQPTVHAPNAPLGEDFTTVHDPENVEQDIHSNDSTPGHHKGIPTTPEGVHQVMHSTRRRRERAASELPPLDGEHFTIVENPSDDDEEDNDISWNPQHGVETTISPNGPVKKSSTKSSNARSRARSYP